MVPVLFESENKFKVSPFILNKKDKQRTFRCIKIHSTNSNQVNKDKS